eukprot:scaffold45177_cov16-Prasinocladus_malaysianus.AAC.1
MSVVAKWAETAAVNRLAFGSRDNLVQSAIILVEIQLSRSGRVGKTGHLGVKQLSHAAVM